MTDNLTERVKDALTKEQINELVGDMGDRIDLEWRYYEEVIQPSQGSSTAPDWLTMLERALTAIRQLQEAQKDAERYRWLRDNCNLIAVQTLEMNSDEDLDAAIDAAIQTKEQGS